MEGRILAMLRTPGVEVVLEYDGWLRISLPDGYYVFAKRGDGGACRLARLRP